jgi:hypothetical protein
MTTQPSTDVRAHVHRADRASNADFEAETGPGTASAGAHARPISHRTDLWLVPALENSDVSEEGLGELLRREITAGREQAEGSELAGAPLSIFEAARTIAPASGEAKGKLAWVAMMAGGLLRLIFVGAGHLVAHAGATRIRASVSATVLVAAFVVSVVLRSVT